MFMVRAIFWITLVAFLLPRAPHLGLGGLNGVSLWSGLPLATSTVRTALDCGEYKQACQTGLDVIDHFQATALIGLARVKAEIEQQKRVREHTSGA